MTIDEVLSGQQMSPSETLGRVQLHEDINPNSDSGAFRLYPKHYKRNTTTASWAARFRAAGNSETIDFRRFEVLGTAFRYS
jgi:hypothetical protein